MLWPICTSADEDERRLMATALYRRQLWPFSGLLPVLFSSFSVRCSIRRLSVSFSAVASFPSFPSLSFCYCFLRRLSAHRVTTGEEGILRVAQFRCLLLGCPLGSRFFRPSTSSLPPDTPTRQVVAVPSEKTAALPMVTEGLGSTALGAASKISCCSLLAVEGQCRVFPVPPGSLAALSLHAF